MPLAKESGTDFKPVSEGTKMARCYGVIGLGTQPSDNPKYKPSYRVLILWEIPEEVYEFEGKEIPMTIMKEYSASLGKKTKPSNLRKDLDSWRGRPFTEEEAAGFPIEKIINAPCMLSIVHYQKRDMAIGAKIIAITGVHKSMQVPELTRETLHYEIDFGKGDQFKALPEWIQSKISRCIEWCPSSQAVPEAAAEVEPEPVEDDGVPFSFFIPQWIPFAASAAAGLIA